jgi:chromate transporter
MSEMRDELARVVSLACIFGMLSLLAVGGGTAVLPEMKHVTVDNRGWLTADQFNDYYSIGQFAPGPNMLMISLIGYHVAGYAGAAAATIGFFVPFSLLSFFSSRVWDRFSKAPWRISIQKGLAPVSIGLMFSGVYAVGHAAIDSWLSAAVAVATASIILTVKIRPIYLMIAGGLMGVFFFG